jgi:hypothetical protein
MKALLALVLLTLPAFGQFTNAHSIWGRAISSAAPTDGQSFTWSAAQNKYVLGSGTSQASIFASGSSVTRQVECQHGTVSYTALTAAATSQEITIQSSIATTVRWAHAFISETTQFTNATGLTVTMGRPGASTNYEMSGAAFPLLVSSGDTNYWSFHPIPPAITGANYSIVLNFSTTSGNLGNGSATLLTGGVATWEVCGYAAQ